MLLVAGTLVPFVLALSKGPAWGWGSAATLICFAIIACSAVGFVAVERRVRTPLVDLRLLRNGILVGSTIVILIGSGTINGLMFVISLYFQDPAGMSMSPLQAGLATLPAAAGIILIAPFVSTVAAHTGTRQAISLGFVITTGGFAALMFLTTSWGYGLFVLPLVAIAVGMGFSNGGASSAATSSVPPHEVGSASGISNMARYAGAALLTAATATIYGTNAAATGVGARSALLMAIVSAVGIPVALFYGRHRPQPQQPVDRAAAATVVVHTVPGSAHADAGAAGR